MNNILFTGLKYFLNNPDIFTITIVLTTKCNFSCKYCNVKSDSSDNSAKTVLKFEDFKTVMDQLSKLNKQIGVTLTGGEPTLHPDFKKMLQYIDTIDNIKNVTLLSNMSKDKKIYYDYFNLLKNKNTTLLPSFHREFIKLENFVDKIKYLLEQSFELYPFRFMIHSPDCKDLYENFKIKYPNIKHEISYLFSDTSNIKIKHTDTDYTTKYEDVGIVNDQPNTNNFRLYLCRSFGQLMYIHPDGTIARCGIDHSNRYNIYKDNINDLIETKAYIVCDKKECLCNLHIPKFKNKSYIKDI